MKKNFVLVMLLVLVNHSFSQQLKITGGVSYTKGTIDADVLKEVIQDKQEEVFARLFSNIVVKYFQKSGPTDGIYNFPTYYALFNLVTDLTIGKSKTTVSKAVVNSSAELAYIYAFVRYCQLREQNLINADNQPEGTEKSERLKIVKTVDKNGQVEKDKERLKTLNYYLEAAFDVLMQDNEIRKRFSFKRPLSSSEIKVWYDYAGLINDSTWKDVSFNNMAGQPIRLPELITSMKSNVDGFLSYSEANVDESDENADLQKMIKAASGLRKKAIGLDSITEEAVDNIKLLLLEYAKQADYLFDRNVVKQLLSLVVENTHFGVSEDQKINQVYVDVEGLILSLDKEFVTKNKKSSISSPLWFVNPRLFFTIGTSTAFFLNNNNRLDNTDGNKVALKNLTLASEKVGFRVKVWDGGYTHSFAPGELYEFHGSKYVWKKPQRKPLISSVYYNIYGSGLLYNVLNLKTNRNFDFGYVSSNIGVQFFNGLEFSSGVGIVYQNGLDAKNAFLKIDFDIPIVDYLLALKKKNK